MIHRIVRLASLAAMPSLAFAAAASAQTVIVLPPRAPAASPPVVVAPAPPPAPAPLPSSEAPAPAPGPVVTAQRGGEVVIPNVGQLIVELGAKQTPKGTLVSLSGDVLFDFNKATLRPDAQGRLIKLAELIRQTHPPHVDITGNTDSIGSADYNLDLSVRRAQAVEDWLKTEGQVPEENFVVQGHGKDDPVAPNTLPDGADNPAGRQLNRRVDILLAKS